MSMYALQVMTGMEAEITQKLRGKGVDARCPQERRMIRRGGKWQEQLYTLFPSYIFVTEPVEFHTVTVPDEAGDYTFKAYFSNVGDELLRKKGAKNYWKGLTVNFIAKKPART